MTATLSIDLTDPAFWRRPHADRAAAFAALRGRSEPVFFPERGAARTRSTKGFYALVRHADVVAASRNPEVFTSGSGVTMPKPARWVRTVFGDSMVNLDDPRHARLRGIVSRAFTPRVVRRIADDMGGIASSIVDDVVAGRPEDFVAAVAAQLPFRVICTMMGIPEAERPAILDRVERSSGHTGGFRLPGQTLRAMARLQHTIGRIGRERRANPTDDLISALVTADVDGRGLNARELGAFFNLLLVAGVETTRNAIAHALHLITVHPAQRELLLADYDGRIGGFVEEVVRYCSPIIQFRRTLSRDHDLNGHRLREGEDVVLFYNSANMDETVFTDPDRFDLTRSPNPHVGFGGGGPHFCLGTALARQEMTVLFRELFTRLPEIRSVGEPELVPSNFDNRISRLRFTY